MTACTSRVRAAVARTVTRVSAPHRERAVTLPHTLRVARSATSARDRRLVNVDSAPDGSDLTHRSHRVKPRRKHTRETCVRRGITTCHWNTVTRQLGLPVTRHAHLRDPVTVALRVVARCVNPVAFFLIDSRRGRLAPSVTS